MIMKYFWKLWLQLNFLTKEVDNDYTASVSMTGKTLRNADLARILKDAGSEWSYETILYILEQADRIAREQLQRGYSVLTGLCQLSPRVTGSWIGANAKFDPARHKITLDIVPSAEMREALKEVGVEVLGVRDDGAFIGLVTDTATGLADGTITAGDDIRIDGDKLKIAPEGEDGLGVFFIDADGGIFPVTRRLTQNDPKRLIARVPDLPAGQYRLRVTTRYTTATTLLKEPRTIEYDRLLVAP
jgi:hypothetical protein